MRANETITIGSLETFLDQFGGVYEHSTWVAERAWKKLTGGKPKFSLDIFNAMRATVESTSHAEKLNLLKLHPELAVQSSDFEILTNASQKEQSSAGLNHCTPSEYEEFMRLNKTYKDRFGFPFIFAVKGYDKLEILEVFQARITNSQKQEFETALIQVHVIALNRIEGIMT